nr:carbon starvation CstA family protein [Amphibacillus cookii]
MIIVYTFLAGILFLIIGYFTYGRIIEKVFGINDSRQTPAYSKQDNVDYLPMNTKKNAMIQLISIAGVGPIFGPIMGALYGPVAFLWIAIGCIFAGGVHDYLTGMISIRNGGAHLPELTGKFLGRAMRHVVNFFSVLLLLLVGTVFVSSSAELIYNMFDGFTPLIILIILIFCYYILSTMMPIDKVIGRIYPYLGATLLLGTVLMGIGLVLQQAPIPELSFNNQHPEGTAIFPLLFLTISCGALSGFHATQSPIIARTVNKESNGRKIFYGMMVAEGLVAMVWAAAAMSLFDGPVTLNELIHTIGTGGIVSEAAGAVLGSVIGTIVIISVITLPITSGDTAFRSARMVIADYFKLGQKKIINRLFIAIPIFGCAVLLTTIDFTMLWRYFSWANQTMAAIALWIGTVYLYNEKKHYIVAMVPALFITMAVITYILTASIGFGLPIHTSYLMSTILTVGILSLFYLKGSAGVGVPFNKNLKKSS